MKIWYNLAYIRFETVVIIVDNATNAPLLKIMEGIDLSTVYIKHAFGHCNQSPTKAPPFGASEEEILARKREIHSHNCFELNYILEGHYNVLADGKRSDIGAYDLIIYSPHCEHGSEFLSEHSDGINVWFNAEYPVNLQPCFAAVKDQTCSLRWLFEQILSEYTAKRRDMDTVVSALLSTLVLYICRLLRETQSVSTDALMKNVLSYIDMNYYLDLNVSNLANMINVSKSYFHKLFRDKTGVSPLQYINNVRVKQAKDILRKTNASIVDVSATVGFEDVRYFSRLFKKSTGMSPNKYRQWSRKENTGQEGSNAP